MRRVCLDASVWIKVLTEEPGSQRAQQLVESLFRERTEIVAPSLMQTEVGSVLRKKWSRRMLSDELLRQLWESFLELPIAYVDIAGLTKEAWRIAAQNNLVHLYDAIYLALCDGIEFWTADERLVRSVKQSGAVIRLL